MIDAVFEFLILGAHDLYDVPKFDVDDRRNSRCEFMNVRQLFGVRIPWSVDSETEHSDFRFTFGHRVIPSEDSWIRIL